MIGVVLLFALYALILLLPRTKPRPEMGPPPRMIPPGDS